MVAGFHAVSTDRDTKSCAAGQVVFSDIDGLKGFRPQVGAGAGAGGLGGAAKGDINYVVLLFCFHW